MCIRHFCSAEKFVNLARARLPWPSSWLQVKWPTSHITALLSTVRFFKENKLQRMNKYYIADNSEKAGIHAVLISWPGSHHSCPPSSAHLTGLHGISPIL